MLKLSDFYNGEKNIPVQKIRDMFPLFFGLIVGSTSDVLFHGGEFQNH
jgi:hypothetical protein